MPKLKTLISSILLVSTLTGCMAGGPKQTGGQLIGGVTGALIGSQFGQGSGRLLGVAVGALAGSFLGGAIGHRLDENDKQMAQRTMENTLEHAPDNQSHGWRNPNNNHSGQFTVLKTQEFPQDSLVCRDYVHTVIIDGQQERVHGRACRDIRDVKSTWQVQS